MSDLRLATESRGKDMKSRMNQRGATLIELMIGLALSLIVTTSMVGLMSNSLGTASRVIQMTQMTDEMRNAMSMVTRDVRRANYSAHAIYCYANSDCGVDGTTILNDLTIGGDSCLIFNVDREQNNFNAADAAPGGFRRAVRADGAGYIEMWVGGAGPTCGDNEGVAGDDWFPLTDPDFVDITTFTIVTTQFNDSVTGESGTTTNQRTNEVKFEMIGVLQLDDSITRELEDTIKVRNDVIWKS